MIAFEYEGVELDHCIECKGTWLDAGELDQIARLAGAPEQGSLAGQIEHAAAGEKLKRKCPRCGKRLKALAVRIDEGKLTVDRCPRGEGFWFDRGELIALIRSSVDDPADRAVRDFLGGLFHHELEEATKGD